MLAEDVPRLMNMLPREEQAYMASAAQNETKLAQIGSTIFHDQENTPFGEGTVEGINAGKGEYEWIVERSRGEYDQIFVQLSPQNGKISGASARQEMIKSKLV